MQISRTFSKRRQKWFPLFGVASTGYVLSALYLPHRVEVDSLQCKSRCPVVKVIFTKNTGNTDESVIHYHAKMIALTRVEPRITLKQITGVGLLDIANVTDSISYFKFSRHWSRVVRNNAQILCMYKFTSSSVES